MPKITSKDTNDFILVKGARMHNLKNVDVAIPKRKLVVITGVSGSGKSSLAFDTLFAEGQRRYIESLSSYARQFLGKLQKPDVDQILGISPAIAIEQKVNTRNPRSTVGTSTEIYDYLKLLFARIGKTISPVSGTEVKSHQVSDVVDFISKHPRGSKILVLAHHHTERDTKRHLNILLQQGFSRIKVGNNIHRIDDFLEDNKKFDQEYLWVVIDRLSVNLEEENLNRMADSIQTAFFEGEGECTIEILEHSTTHFSNRFEADGLVFEKPSEHLFSFNNPYGACKKCEGFGSVMGIDEKKVIPNESLSLYEGAVNCWKGEKLSKWKDRFIMKAHEHKFPVHKPYFELNEEEKGILWNGSKRLRGIRQFFAQLEKENYKVQNRVLLARYRGKSTCPDCNGTRLRKEALWVKVANKTINDIVHLPLREALDFFQEIALSENDLIIAERLLKEITNRLHFLNEVGLGYLTLNRLSSTLSGGESQRINLATSLGSSLVGSMYILDEPSIGLHSKDTERLIYVLQALRDVGNTVIVVEHDEEIMQAADELIDIGPDAGTGGGKIVFQGSLNKINQSENSLTAQYLHQKLKIEVPKARRQWHQSVIIKGARENNLQNINVCFPLNTLTVVTGVSGSGKSSLIKQILFPSMQKKIQGYTTKLGAHDSLEGDYKNIEQIEFVDQNPIGRSSRSNPVTYIKAYDDIRNLYSRQALSQVRGYKSGHFSFNIAGGRCEVCEGEGNVKIEMQFMADVHLPCETCNSQRFKQEILEINFAGKSISDILHMTVDDAITFFQENKQKRIVSKLLPLQQVGLGYVHLGQSSSTLSGGEAQRIKLASFLSKGKNAEKTLFIFDEPTTGLHFHDIKKLLKSFNALIDNGHSIICIEHNADIIKCADWIIDLGPEGGENGGQLLFEGIPEELVKCKHSHTGHYLKEKL
ncbi:MAG: excinuclease ABC subunit A [Flavobacteriales bacterium]|nr:excinuclease ABC subunit A [Flavobacteriales bacterium]